MLGFTRWEKFQDKVRQQAEKVGFDDVELSEILAIIKKSKIEDPDSLIKALDRAIDSMAPTEPGSVRILGGNKLQVLTRARKKLDSLTKLDMLY